MNNLIQLEKIVDADVRNLRLLYDKIETNVRAISRIESKHLGAVLIPIVLQTLPNVINLQISRQHGIDNWSIKEFLKFLSNAISARESYELLKGDQEGGEFETNGRKDYEYYKKRGTLSSLHISHRNKFCVFCGDENHYSDKCDVVMEFEARKEKLKRENYYFKCLRRGHLATECRKKIYCYKCKMQNNHNTALFRKDVKKEIKDNGVYVTTGREHVLLQTAEGYVTDQKEREEEWIKILLYSGSHQSYITERVANKLRLKPICSVNTNIKTFGMQNGKEMTLHEYEFVLKPRDKNGSIYVTALAVPKICEPINDQYIKLMLQHHEFLRNLKLVDYGDHPNREIDLLIRAYIYIGKL